MIKIEEAMEPNVLVLNKGDTIVDAAKFSLKMKLVELQSWMGMKL